VSSLAIRVENLSKRFFIGAAQEKPTTFYDAVTSTVSAPWRRFRMLSQKSAELEEFWALRDLDFEVRQGEAIGIIGRNGAGKSTLLKILSRIVEPTTGRIEIYGRVASLLEVGTGFHPELTGRENIYLNGSILGMSNKEIDAKFDAIVDFSGVEKFLETPFKRYSSGMGVRLAFAVAAHLDPEILIIDEVLAVGDADFQKKCLGKMNEVATGGRTVLFVSHSMPAVRNLTERCLYLRNGRIEHSGPTSETVEVYLSEIVAQAPETRDQNLEVYRRHSGRETPVRIENISLNVRSDSAELLPCVTPEDDVEISFTVHSGISLPDSCFSILLTRNRDQRVTTLFSKDAHFDIPLTPGRQVITCRLGDLPLSPGSYAMDCAIKQDPNSPAYDVLVDYPLFRYEIPEVQTGQLDWTQRPWGAIHWDQATWSLREND
jgi:lipopolysaccharide transport system ATP-binding protein